MLIYAGMKRALSFALLLLLATSSVAHARHDKPRWGHEATRFMKGKVQVKSRKLFINVRSFGRAYKEQAQWGKASKNTIEVRFDPHLNVGHTSIRVGHNEYQMLGSKAAKANRFEQNNILNTSAGAVFRISRSDRRAIDRAFTRVVQSANKYNFPAFSLNGRTLTVEQRANGWEILKTKRRAETRNITAKLVKDGGQEYLESPNGYRQRVLGKTTGPDGKVQLRINSRSCTSFVTNTLSALKLETMPRINNTVSARGLANTLMAGTSKQPHGIVHYSVDGDMPADMPAAVAKVLSTRSSD